MMDRRILIIGGGPGAIEAAQAAATAGARVTLISDSPLGGRATWQTLLPSKAWLGATAADSQGWAAQTASRLTDHFARFRAVADAWSRQQADMLTRLGVEIVEGKAAFESACRLSVDRGKDVSPLRVTGDAVIIATGAVPRFPAALEPDGEFVFAPHLTPPPASLPASMVVIGGGGPAVEYVDAFSRLGIRVTWLPGPGSILPFFHVDAMCVLTDRFAQRGVEIAPNELVENIDRSGNDVAAVTSSGATHRASRAFVSVGYVPDLQRLRVSAAGLQLDAHGFLSTDSVCRTNVPTIYAVGDAARPYCANAAMAQGRVAGRHAAGAAVESLRPENTMLVIYTDPEIAQVGRLEAQDGSLQTVRVPYARSLKAHLTSTGEGFLMLAYDRERCVVGGVAVGHQASEVLAPIALATRMGATVEDLAGLFVAHPTLSELAFVAAREAV